MADSAESLINFVHASPTPYHVVDNIQQRILSAGFVQLDEKKSWQGVLRPGGKYFYHRNSTTIVAFTIGGKYKPGNEFKIIGAHTDSPVLKLKPKSALSSNGYIQMNVETYGGGLWHTWLDRDLTLAGCVIVKADDGSFTRRLVNLKKPLLRLPNLCIHLQTSDERQSLTLNKEVHLQPIFSLIESTLNKGEDQKSSGESRHSSLIMELLAAELGVDKDKILDFDLTLADTQPGAAWGARDEFLSSPRLDNQAHCYTGMVALLAQAENISDDTGVCMLTCFDHEEIGSSSAQGAGSPIMSEAISRVVNIFDPSDEILKITIRNSLLISADVAHAVHPNYAVKHESNHQPHLNQGTVIKTNSNQRYATNAETGFFLRELSRRADVPVQEFVVRNDCPCGSTIGPIIASKVGIRTVDVGVPSLSMHSIRETMGCKDIGFNIKLFQKFFSDFGELDKSCNF
uniref:Aspartyl aminopeptidase n=1 Tax=Acartia pacifica TaxID=335913 RepID=A0A0U2V5F2_ACAPC|nr:putative aspartyl aminopeptidase-like protein [Acartia pacifica]